MKLGIYPGRYPAIVKSYNQAKRTCRIEIPGVTDGGDTLPEAEIEYPIGDKSRNGTPTEIEILPNDTVWVSFLAGDPRYPIITGWRNPETGNSADWRRYHHKNIELLADQIMHFMVSSSEITIDPSSIVEKTNQKTTDAPDTIITGNVHINGSLVVDQSITGTGGLAISGGNGASVDGSMTTTGDVVAGGVSLQKHVHTGDSGGTTSAPN